MEEQLSPLAVTHLLQHTLRSLCTQKDSQWVYAVFWRILPRNFPPPKWDLQGGTLDRSRGNRRNWILVWEDGFCNFAACAGNCVDSSAGYGGGGGDMGLQPELFFKMSHEIYSYGEGLIGKVAADHSHKWVYREPQDHEVNPLSAWSNPSDSHPRTWEAQFQSGIKTIALIAVREGVLQLGAVTQVMEDPSYAVQLCKKFGYLESIPGVLLPHPSASVVPLTATTAGCNDLKNWATFHTESPALPPPPPPRELLHQHLSQQGRIAPSMSSLEALLSTLPSIGPSSPFPPMGYPEVPMFLPTSQRPTEAMALDRTAKEEVDNEYVACDGSMEMAGRGVSSMSAYYVHRKTSEGY